MGNKNDARKAKAAENRRAANLNKNGSDTAASTAGSQAPAAPAGLAMSKHAQEVPKESTTVKPTGLSMSKYAQPVTKDSTAVAGKDQDEDKYDSKQYPKLVDMMPKVEVKQPDIHPQSQMSWTAMFSKPGPTRPVAVAPKEVGRTVIQQINKHLGFPVTE